MERDFEIYEERRPRPWLWAVALMLLAFVGGIAAMGYVMTHDARAAGMLHLETIDPARDLPVVVPAMMVRPQGPAAPAGGAAAGGQADPAMANRVATLEDKVDDIESQAREATGDASRAEGLLVAFAARRALDRGVPLGYLEGLLRQRFSASQPQAVATILSAARQPVTLADLQNELDSAAPALSASGTPQQSWWQSLREQLGSLVVVRRVGEPSTLPVDRLARAQRMLEAGQVDGALAEVMRLPERAPAAKWIGDARRYLAGRNALDQVETAALLDPSAAAPAPLPDAPHAAGAAVPAAQPAGQPSTPAVD